MQKILLSFLTALIMIMVILDTCSAQYTYYNVVKDPIAANVSLVNLLNATKVCPANGTTAGLPCHHLNCYCNTIDRPVVTHTCEALPGYNKYRKPGAACSAEKVDFCKNSCNGDEAKSAIAGGCQCSCPTCFSAQSTSDSMCLLNTTCCGPNGTVQLTAKGDGVCVCDQGYQVKENYCVDVDECLMGTAKCSRYAQCINSSGSYSCSCHAGFDDVSPSTDRPGSVCIPSSTLFDELIPRASCFNCDSCTRPVTVQNCSRIIIGSRTYTNVAASANGVVTFGQFSNSYEDAVAAAVPVVALFGTNLDTTSSGSVCTSVHTARSNSTNWRVVQLVNNFVQYSVDARFRAETVFIYSLNNARPYGHDNHSVTAHLIIAAGLKSTYAVYVFPRGKINWPETWNVNVTIGSSDHVLNVLTRFSVGDSRSSAVFRMDLLSNLNPALPGFWIQKVGSLQNDQLELIASACCRATQDILPVTVPHTCPYSASVAASEQQLHSTPSSTPTLQCYVDRFWSNQTVFNPELNQHVTVRVKKRCCYHKDNGRLAQQAPDGMALTDQAGDADFYANCPASKVSQYRPIAKNHDYDQTKVVAWGQAYGDVHFRTFDGLFYDFHGVQYNTKEQITVRSIAGVQPSFALHCVAPQFWNWPVSAMKACSLRCNGGPVLQLVHGDTGRHGAAQVYKDGVLIGSAAAFLNQRDDFPFPNMEFSGSNSVLIATCPGTPIVTIYINNPWLSVTVALSVFWRGKVEGLLGNFDGSSTNDIDDRIKTGLYKTQLLNASLKESIMSNWLVQPEETLMLNVTTTRSKRDIDRQFRPSSSDGLVEAVKVNDPAQAESLLTGVLSRAKRDANANGTVSNTCNFCSDFASPNVANWTCEAAAWVIMNNTCTNIETYSACMLDLAATCDVNSVAKDLANYEETARTAALAGYQPPQFRNQDAINVTFGQTFRTQLNVTGNYTSLWVQPLPGYNHTTNLPVLSGLQLVWTVSMLQPVPFEVLVSDNLNNVASWSPVIYYCGCANNGSCSFDYLSNPDLTASSSVYMAQCVCVQGYSGDQCELNICQGLTSPCDPLVTCTPNGNGSAAVCGACPSNTLTVGGRCVSDSAAGSQSPCSNAGCQSGCVPYYPNMTYTCTCPAGWQLDASLKNCTDTDECLHSSVCSGSGNCTNTPGSYTCTCNSGFTASPTGGCADVNECAYDACQALQTNRTCTNTLGSFSCACKNGYEPVNGTDSCAPIDLCGTKPCSAICNSYLGGYYCSCPTGMSLVNMTHCEEDVYDLCHPAYTSCPLSHCSMNGSAIICAYFNSTASPSDRSTSQVDLDPNNSVQSFIPKVSLILVFLSFFCNVFLSYGHVL